MEEIKVASVQMDIKQGDKNANLSKAVRFLNKASEKKVDLVCFSEYFSTGYDPEHLRDLAEPIPGNTTKVIGERAEEHSMWIAAPIVEREKGMLYSTLVLIGPDGKVHGQHRKAHPWVIAPREEYKILTRGKDFKVVRIDDIVIGSLIDADMDFPEAARILALKGAEIILIPLSAELLYLDVIRVVPFVRAIDNVAYVITTNRVGSWAGYRYAGCSMIISPLGEILSYISDREGLITATVDLRDLRNWRKEVWSPFKRFNYKAYKDLKQLLHE